MFFGEGKYTYELIDLWAKLPVDLTFLPLVSGLAVDSQDRVYVFNRSTHPVMVFNRDGNLLAHWGEGLFKRPHGICIGPDESVYCADDMNHTVRKFTPDGKLLMTLGKENQPSDTGYIHQSRLSDSLDTIKRSASPFNRPAGVHVTASGEIFVSDGYGNARIHKFNHEGKLLFSFGEPGYGPGQFRLPHVVRVDGQQRIWVCDRENSRIQIFDDKGEFLGFFTKVINPTGVFIDDTNKIVYVHEGGPARRLAIFTIDGELIVRWGNDPGTDRMTAPVVFMGHSMIVDSRGDIYLGGNPTSVNVERIAEGDRRNIGIQKLVKQV